MRFNYVLILPNILYIIILPNIQIVENRIGVILEAISIYSIDKLICLGELFVEYFELI